MTEFKGFVVALLAILVVGCKSSTDPNSPTPPVTPIEKQVDPATPATVGFFENSWTEKQFVTPAFTETAPPTQTSSTVTVDYAQVLAKIPTTAYGHNANLWMGQIVTEAKLLENITDLKPNIIRFPGGSISDIFFWNVPYGTRPPNTPDQLWDNSASSFKPASFWYGKHQENWTINIENYYNLLTQSKSKGLITINYGYARYGTGKNPVADAAHLAADWVRYDKGRTQYWEIGNETFADWEASYKIDVRQNQDKQPELLNGQLYAQHFQVFADSMKKAAAETGATIYIGAVLVENTPGSWVVDCYKTWNEKMLRAINNRPDYYVVHNYYTAYQTNAPAAEILPTATKVTQEMMAYVRNQFTTYGATPKPIALDEWNIFSTGSKQQVSHINGMHAVLLVNESIKNQYGLSARWDLVNGWDNGNDHGLFSDGNEPGVDKWTPRPAFYHLYYLQQFSGDRMIQATRTATGDYNVYATSFSSGHTGLTFVNSATTSMNVAVTLKNVRPGDRYYWVTLTGDTDNGEFSRKVIINGNKPTGIAGGPANFKSIKPNSAKTSNGITLTLPPRSSVFVVIEGQK